jgi:hypothetical protein
MEPSWRQHSGPRLACSPEHFVRIAVLTACPALPWTIYKIIPTPESPSTSHQNILPSAPRRPFPSVRQRTWSPRLSALGIYFVVIHRVGAESAYAHLLLEASAAASCVPTACWPLLTASLCSLPHTPRRFVCAGQATSLLPSVLQRPPASYHLALVSLYSTGTPFRAHAHRISRTPVLRRSKPPLTV